MLAEGRVRCARRTGPEHPRDGDRADADARLPRTIVGLIRAFMNGKSRANVKVSDLAGGIYEAMITTAAGLILAFRIICCCPSSRARVGARAPARCRHELFLQHLASKHLEPKPLASKPLASNPEPPRPRSSRISCPPRVTPPSSDDAHDRVDRADRYYPQSVHFFLCDVFVGLYPKTQQPVVVDLPRAGKGEARPTARSSSACGRARNRRFTSATARCARGARGRSGGAREATSDAARSSVHRQVSIERTLDVLRPCRRAASRGFHRHEAQGTYSGYRVWGVGFGLRVQRSHCHSSFVIRLPLFKSEIRNPKSAINLQSPISNPQFFHPTPHTHTPFPMNVLELKDISLRRDGTDILRAFRGPSRRASIGRFSGERLG